jgi:hypothetical protein
MLLVKRLLQPPADIKQKLPTDVKKLAFLEKIYPKAQATFRSAIRAQKVEQYVDVVAAALTLLKMNGFLSSKLVTRATEVCRDVVRRQGYRVRDWTELSQILGSRRNIVLIPGCQGRTILKSRAEAAADFCSKASGRIDVIFSGSHPPDSKEVIEPDEAGMAQQYFNDAMKKRRSSLPRGVHLIVPTAEVRSKNTEQNVSYSLRTRPFRDPGRKNVIVVSSAFHLPRVAQALEKRLRRQNHGVERLILVSAEPIGRLTKVSNHETYAKQALFLLYTEIFREVAKQLPQDRRTTKKTPGGKAGKVDKSQAPPPPIKFVKPDPTVQSVPSDTREGGYQSLPGPRGSSRPHGSG